MLNRIAGVWPAGVVFPAKIMPWEGGDYGGCGEGLRGAVPLTSGGGVYICKQNNQP